MKTLIALLVSAGVGIAIVPFDTKCIHLAGVSYQRIVGRDAVSTLYLAHRDDESGEHVMAMLLTLRKKFPKPKR